MVSQLDDSRAKLGRAVDHFNHLEGEMTRFFQIKPYPVVVELGRDGRQDVLYIRVAREIPRTAWALIIGDAIHNARSALDYVAWELARKTTPVHRLSEDRATLYPLVESETEFLNSRTQNRLRYVSPGARAAIQGLQPYNRPHWPFGPLSLLESLDIADKHKTLTLTTYLPADEYRVRVSAPAGADLLVTTLEAPGFFEDGTEIGRYTTSTGARVNVQGSFGVRVAFGEGQARGFEVLPTLRRILRCVQGDLALFDRHFALL